MITEGEKRVYKILYLNKTGVHIREISRLSKLTLPAVARHIGKGEERKTIVSERRGRLKICKLNFKSPALVSTIHSTELSRFQKLPHAVQEAFTTFVSDLEERPLIAAVFGSFARGAYTKSSDLDILLIFQRMDEKLMQAIEGSANKVKGRTAVNLQPVSLNYQEFEKNMLNPENEFMKDIRSSAMVLHGLDIYLKLLGRFYQ